MASNFLQSFRNILWDALSRLAQVHWVSSASVGFAPNLCQSFLRSYWV
jgi:hypothetical protein